MVKTTIDRKNCPVNIKNLYGIRYTIRFCCLLTQTSSSNTFKIHMIELKRRDTKVQKLMNENVCQFVDTKHY